VGWLQLRLASTRADAGALEQALLDAGALSVTLQDAGDEPVLEPGVGETPLWRDLVVTGLFRADTPMDPVLETLRPLPGGESAQVEILEDKDWTREWMQHYRPMRFGAGLWICPSWLQPPEPDAVNLLLDPGLAFGTGTHPTTALCLEALSGMPLAGSRVVDYGCGSGILAIAAARLGAATVLAVDNDPQALSATRDNASRNAVAPHQLSVAAPGDYDHGAWAGSADLVVANILAGPLAALSRELCALLSPGGTLLMAGLLETQMQELVDHYAPTLTLAERSRRDEWVCLAGKRASL
jgi:ribosomal protein L11 methyltransferase